MKKQEIIQDMLKILRDYCDSASIDECDIHDCYSCFAISLYNAGYRKIAEENMEEKEDVK